MRVEGDTAVAIVTLHTSASSLATILTCEELSIFIKQSRFNGHSVISISQLGSPSDTHGVEELLEP